MCFFYFVQTLDVIGNQSRVSRHMRVLFCECPLKTSACVFNQSSFKASHVTRRPSLKRLSGIQVQPPIFLNGETSNSSNLLTKLTIK